MRIPLCLSGLIAVSLLVSGLASSSAASAAAPGISSLGAASSSSCVLRNGQAYCWGSNGVGQLGNGSTGDSYLPVAVDTSGVLAGKTLIQLSSGGASSCALDSSGAVYCWGYNNGGQLGDGNFTNASNPVAVGGVLAGQTVTQISVGPADACALDMSGDAYCWGEGQYGQLGDGNTNAAVCPWRWTPAGYSRASPSARSSLVT
jgi:alpha-tubulin suppressor-like RCC1 family protein